MTELLRAKELLFSDEYTCVVMKGEQVHTSRFRGVKPLVSWYVAGNDFTDFCAADKVVGKATAFLYRLLHIKAVYANVISKSALEVLETAGIVAEYGTVAEHIINRNGDGVCPFELAVMDIDDENKAYEVIRSKMDEMNIVLE